MPAVKDVFESRPERTVLERVSTMISVHGANLWSGGGRSARQARGLEAAGLLSGIKHDDALLVTTAERAFAAKYLGWERERRPLTDALHRWGAQQFLIQHPRVTLSGGLHYEVTAIATDDYIAGRRTTRRDICRSLRVGENRWAKGLREIYRKCHSRLALAEQLLSDHFRSQVKGE